MSGSLLLDLGTVAIRTTMQSPSCHDLLVLFSVGDTFARIRCEVRALETVGSKDLRRFTEKSQAAVEW